METIRRLSPWGTVRPRPTPTSSEGPSLLGGSPSASSRADAKWRTRRVRCRRLGSRRISGRSLRLAPERVGGSERCPKLSRNRPSECGWDSVRHLQWLARAWPAEEVGVRKALNPRCLPYSDRPVLSRMHRQGSVTGHERPRYIAVKPSVGDRTTAWGIALILATTSGECFITVEFRTTRPSGSWRRSDRRRCRGWGGPAAGRSVSAYAEEKGQPARHQVERGLASAPQARRTPRPTPTKNRRRRFCDTPKSDARRVAGCSQVP